MKYYQKFWVVMAAFSSLLVTQNAYAHVCDAAASLYNSSGYSCEASTFSDGSVSHYVCSGGGSHWVMYHGASGTCQAASIY